MSIKLKDIKKGQTFFECQYGCNVQWEALEDAKVQDSGHACLSKRTDGSTLELFCAKGMDHYLKLYSEPEYFKVRGPGDIVPNNI